MAKKKKDEEKVIPTVCFCKMCENGGKIENFMVWCTVKNIFQHSPTNCRNYSEKEENGI